MVYKVNNTTVIDDSRNLTNIANITVTGTVSGTLSGSGAGLTGLSSPALSKSGVGVSETVTGISTNDFSSGNNSTFGYIKTDGTLWVWGYNALGALGLGDVLHRSSPVQVGSGTNWSTLSIGSSYMTAAVKSDNTGWVWGDNTYGELGLSTAVSYSSPVQITGAWSRISTSGLKSFGIKTDGTLWGWGFSQSVVGGLGFGNANDFNYSSPVQIGTGTTWSWLPENMSNAFLAKKTDNTLWVWGYNAYGALGLGDTNSTSTPVQLGAATYSWVSTSQQAVFAVRTNGTLWAWGTDTAGQLGLGAVNTYPNGKSSPTQIGAGTDWRYVSTRGTNSANLGTAAIKTNGTLWTWGGNSTGALGLGDYNHRSSPVQVGSDTDWAKISINNSGFAIKTGGTAYAWGDNNNGYLLLPNKGTSNSPVQVTGGGYKFNLTNNSIFSVTITGNASFEFLGVPTTTRSTIIINKDSNYVQRNITWPSSVVWNNGATPSSLSEPGAAYVVNIFTDDGGTTYKGWYDYSVTTPSTTQGGYLYGWGNNSVGAIGDGTKLHRSSPVRVGSDNTWLTVRSYPSHSIGIKSNGTAWAWGSSNNGQLGLGDTVSRSSPTQIGTDTNWAYAYQGEDFTHLVKTTGTQFSMGSNYFSGVLGQNTGGSGSPRSSPVQIGALTNWYTGNANNNDVYAIKTDGTLWAWGYQPFLFNNGSQTAVSSPTQVGTLTNWKKVGGGNSRGFVAIKTDGTLWVSGANYDGKLGLGTTVNRSSPVQVGSDTDWYDAFQASSATFALKTDGSLYGWGNNQYQRLLTGDTVHRSSPILVSTKKYKSVAGGGKNIYGIDTDGRLWGWGDNDYGMVGLGLSTTIVYSSPMQVGSDTDWISVLAPIGNVVLARKGS